MDRTTDPRPPSGSPADPGPLDARPRQPLRVALFNDYDLVVRGLASMLAPFPDLQVVDVSAGDTGVDRPVDVALYDTYGRVGLPWQEIGQLLAQPLATHVALFTFVSSDALIAEALAAGVTGYLWKGLSPAGLADALRRVAHGEKVIVRDTAPRFRTPAPYRWPLEDAGLTGRESEVLALLARGLTNRAIGAQLYLAPETVKTYVRNIYRKLGVSSRAAATARALRDGGLITR